MRGLLIELQNQFDALELAERSVGIAEQTLRIAREEYRLGTRSFEELRPVIQQETDSQRQLIQSRYLFLDALVNLEEAVGFPVTPLPVG